MLVTPRWKQKLNYKRNDLATSDTTNSSCENLKLLETRKHPVQCFFLHGRNQLNNRFDPLSKVLRLRSFQMNHEVRMTKESKQRRSVF